MMRLAWRYRWWLACAGFLLCSTVATWHCLRWLTSQPGSTEEMFARIQIGMSQFEAVAVIRCYDQFDDSTIESVMSWGATKNGQPFNLLHQASPRLGELPSAP